MIIAAHLGILQIMLRKPKTTNLCSGPPASFTRILGREVQRVCYPILFYNHCKSMPCKPENTKTHHNTIWRMNMLTWKYGINRILCTIMHLYTTHPYPILAAHTASHCRAVRYAIDPLSKPRLHRLNLTLQTLVEVEGMPKAWERSTPTNPLGPLGPFTGAISLLVRGSIPI